MLRAGKPRNRGFILGTGKRFFSFPLVSDGLWGPSNPQWVPATVFKGVKPQGCETGFSPPSIAEIKNDGAKPPLLKMPLWRGA
jgi:hypothetical protein